YTPLNDRSSLPAVEELDDCFVVLAYVYFEDETGRRSAAKLVVVPNHVPPPNDCDGANVMYMCGAITAMRSSVALKPGRR
ncbi:MAG: hypothetical protein WAK67_17645, partial [Xanthobacteraceae bacterium]